ncbi:hypothetical protein SLS60_004292 [Paraconiothyrium brasiliense]|uniref:VOC domain-containing protein n=1 Tax=Paraconiothyrium brasiliense TaxID=300254 RepID=A0ABR3RLJ1_9PLEO
MPDHATPNLPSRDFSATSQFYAQFGFTEAWRDTDWMILKRGSITVEFFPHPDLDPATSWFSCCFRMEDVGAFFAEIIEAGVPEATSGFPRAHRPKKEDSGMVVGALLDPDGTLIRLVQI